MPPFINQLLYFALGGAVGFLLVRTGPTLKQKKKLTS